MPFKSGRKLTQRIATGLAAVLLPAVTGSGVALAYGPPFPPPGPPTTGGFECILTSQIVPDFAGKTIGPLRDGDLLVSVHIRAYTFNGPVQVTLTEPYSPGGGCDGGPRIPSRGLGGFKPIGGIGVLIGLTNEPYSHFPRPVTLHVRDVDLTRTELGEVEPLNGNRVGHGGPTTHGTVTLALRSSSDWVYLVKHLKRTHARTTARTRPAHSRAEVLTLTGALLPPGASQPGLGVLLPTNSGSTLSFGGATATGR